jgi:hypothetical protein
METVIAGFFIYFAGKKLADSMIMSKQQLKKANQHAKLRQATPMAVDEYQRDDYQQDILLLNEMNSMDVDKLGMDLADDTQYYRALRGMELMDEENDITNQTATQQQVFVTPAFGHFV